jgi:hypothetical protein
VGVSSTAGVASTSLVTASPPSGPDTGSAVSGPASWPCATEPSAAAPFGSGAVASPLEPAAGAGASGTVMAGPGRRSIT